MHLVRSSCPRIQTASGFEMSLFAVELFIICLQTRVKSCLSPVTSSALAVLLVKYSQQTKKTNMELTPLSSLLCGPSLLSWWRFLYKSKPRCNLSPLLCPSHLEFWDHYYRSRAGHRNLLANSARDQQRTEPHDCDFLACIAL